MSLREPQWRQPYMNKQCWLCENIIGSLVSGQLLHTARCSLSYFTGRHFLLKVALTLRRKKKPQARNCEAVWLKPAALPHFSACFELESILYSSLIHHRVMQLSFLTLFYIFRLHLFVFNSSVWMKMKHQLMLLFHLVCILKENTGNPLINASPFHYFILKYYLCI